MSSNNDKKYWKSVEELNGRKLASKDSEFLEGVTDDFNPEQLTGMSRRKFLALLAASTALTATACSDYTDRGEIVPYNERPDDLIPGKANYYASTCDGCEQKCGVLVKTREGRPIAVEGNPDHPVNAGKLCAKGHASVTELYDPARLKEPTFKGKKISWNEADKKLIASFSKLNESNKELAFVLGNTQSLSLSAILEKLKDKYPTLKLYKAAPFNENQRIEAWEKSYGNRLVPVPDLSKAKILLTLDADILGNEGLSTKFTKELTSRRDIFDVDNFSRTYATEGNLSLTGTNVDYRFRVHPSQFKNFVLALITEVSAKLGKSLPMGIEAIKLNAVVDKSAHKKAKLLIGDLTKYSDQSFVYAGRDLDVETHILVNYLNEMLGAEKVYSNNMYFNIELNDSSKVSELIENINAGKVGAVVHFDVNPAYCNHKYLNAVTKVETKVTHTYRPDETSAVCDYVLPSSHYMEAWNDNNTFDDIVSYTQPVIDEIYNSRQKELSLLSWLNDGKVSKDSYHKFVMDTFNNKVYNRLGTSLDKKRVWLGALHDGVVKYKNTNKDNRSFKNGAIGNFKKSGKPQLAVQVKESYYLGTGKFANNGWLQEIPHPVTKVTWDNYAAISPAFAKQLGVQKDDVIKVAAGKASVELPVIVQPGLADNLVVTEAGYGRSNSGDVANEVGVNVYPLKHSNGKVTVTATGKTYKLATTQEHHALDDDFTKDFHKIRHIIQEGTVAEYKKDHHFLQHHKHELFSIHDTHEYNGNKWAMSIDLNKCTSCGVCVSSCNVENNVPVVGKDQVLVGREMHWMRLDRYYSGTPDEPEVSHQPMLCQHCDNAPCENVCPVNATNHSPDGLNQMAYNRCVGTRYCANNCPYKVRRFNFFDFRDHFEDAYYKNELTDLVNNPEVTVRSRGVMEKCTFCVQRIMDARSEAIRENRELKGSDVKTACQTACPADAIVFGDANDTESEIAKYRKHELGYSVLEVINVKPNVTYIAKLRNLHREDV